MPLTTSTPMLPTQGQGLHVGEGILEFRGWVNKGNLCLSGKQFAVYKTLCCPSSHRNAGCHPVRPAGWGSLAPARRQQRARLGRMRSLPWGFSAIGWQGWRREKRTCKTASRPRPQRGSEEGWPQGGEVLAKATTCTRVRALVMKQMCVWLQGCVQPCVHACAAMHSCVLMCLAVYAMTYNTCVTQCIVICVAVLVVH